MKQRVWIGHNSLLLVNLFVLLLLMQRFLQQDYLHRHMVCVTTLCEAIQFNGNGDIYDSNGGYIGNMNGWDGD